MKKNSILLLSVCLFLFSSCATFYGGYIATSASLSSNNYIYVNRNVNGKSTSSYLLTFGGSKSPLISAAKNNLIQSNKVKDNQHLANITVDYETFVFLLITTVTCTITADIVEFK